VISLFRRQMQKYQAPERNEAIGVDIEDSGIRQVSIFYQKVSAWQTENAAKEKYPPRDKNERSTETMFAFFQNETDEH